MTKKKIKTITLNNIQHEVIFKKVRGAKSIRITVAEGGITTVTGPYFIPFISFEHFLESKKAWLALQLQHLKTLPQKKVQLSREEFLANKEAARSLVHKKLLFWNRYYQFTWGSISIRNQKTRFGSCSVSGNLSFHVSIIFLPEELQDYLVVHELCHLQEMNHQQPFWDLVAKTIKNPHLKAKQLASWGREDI